MHAKFTASTEQARDPAPTILETGWHIEGGSEFVWVLYFSVSFGVKGRSTGIHRDPQGSTGMHRDR